MSKNPTVALKNSAVEYAQIKREIEQHPDVDAQTLIDTLEGATDLNEAVLAIVDHIEELNAQAVGIKHRLERLQERKDRVERTSETLRTAILQAMEIAGVEQIKGDCATVSARKLAGQAVVEDEAQIPGDYWKPQPPKLDKKALSEALKDGKAIPGARLTNGGLSLSIRVK